MKIGTGIHDQKLQVGRQRRLESRFGVGGEGKRSVEGLQARVNVGNLTFVQTCGIVAVENEMGIGAAEA